jgi:hypothetical protein
VLDLTWLTIKDSQLAHCCDLRVPGFRWLDLRTNPGS